MNEAIRTGSEENADAYSDSASINTETLPLLDLDPQQIDVVARSVPGGTKNLQDIYPLSQLQEGMLFHHLLNDWQDTYVLSTAFELQSAAQVALFIDALQKVVDRHDVLRTAVLWENLPRPMQVVCRQVRLKVTPLVLDSIRDPLEQLIERMQPRSSGMDPRRAPLMEVHITSHSVGGRWYALLRVHHLVCDHQSLRTIETEIIRCLAGRERLLPAPIAYRSYVARALAQTRPKEAEAFFRSRLAEVDGSTAPFDVIDVHGDGTRITQVQRPVESALAHLIREQSRRLQVSVLRMFHAAWALVVAHTSGRSDVVFGTVLLTTEQRGVGRDRMLGMSVNTLPMRVNLKGMTAHGLVENVSRELTDLLVYQQTPLPLAQRCSGLPEGAPLFTTLLNCRRSSPDPDMQLGDSAGVRVLARGEAWTNYPITLTVDDTGDQLLVTAQTDRNIDPDRLIGYLQTGMQSLVTALKEAPCTSALSLPILPEAERKQVVETFNATDAPYPRGATIHDVFQEQVARTPESLAIAYEGESLTYAALNAKANQLARYLRTKGVGPDCLVGICIERSVEMIVAVLGVLKAGGAYVPLDPAYPDERLAGIVEDAAPHVVLLQQQLRGKLQGAKSELIALDFSCGDIAENDTHNLDSPMVGADCLAYVIYTSGSTGKPKGVMIGHGSVLNLWQGLEHLYRQSVPFVRVAHNASLTFDASVQQVVQLLSGRTLYLVPQDVRRDPSLLVSFIQKQRIEAIDCTPSQLKSWISAKLLHLDRSPLRLALVGGEAIDAVLWSTLAQCSETTFYNVYGPTECTVDATAARLNEDLMTPHIGRPMQNRRIYILDRDVRPVAIGVTGEIYVGGVGIARGYLNSPELTAERFQQDPFSAEPQARLYKTGDLGRWRADGTIEYLGRNDDQVKLRGFRIELGEIEAQLVRHDAVKESIVMVREDAPGDKRLVAYVVPVAQSDALGVEELREHLRKGLPDHMVPSAIVILDRVPLTPSGKANRLALPVPSADAYLTREYEAPQGELEESVARIWQSLLRVERVGRQDNFFELGGHSLLATRAISQIREQLQVELPLRALFDEPVVAQMARRIEVELNEKAENDATGSRRARELRQEINEMNEEDVLARIAEIEKQTGYKKG